MTPLHFAASRGHNEVASLLLDRGAHIDEEDKVCLTIIRFVSISHSQFFQFSRTPLHHATRRGNKETISLLLENGAQIDAQNKVCTHMLFVYITHNLFRTRRHSCILQLREDTMKLLPCVCPFSLILCKNH